MRQQVTLPLVEYPASDIQDLPERAHMVTGPQVIWHDSEGPWDQSGEAMVCRLIDAFGGLPASKWSFQRELVALLFPDEHAQ